MVQELQQIVDQTLNWLAQYAAFPTATYIVTRVASPLILGSSGNKDEKIRDTVIASSATVATVGLQSFYNVTPDLPKNLETVAGFLGAVGAGAVAGGFKEAAEATFKSKPADAIRDAFHIGSTKGAKYLPLGIVIVDYIARRL